VNETWQRVLVKMPTPLRRVLRDAHLVWQIRRGTFRSDEPEFDRLARWVATGDWVLDVGANLGHYTARLATLVGPGGRVLAFEPVPDTFECLTANVRRLGLHNVTLFNAAVCEHQGLVSMVVPTLASGWPNPYEAHIEASPAAIPVLGLAVDSLAIPRPVTLVKIDVEGHEWGALRGMRGLLERDRPTLIVETFSAEVDAWIEALGYRGERMPGSPNRVYLAREPASWAVPDSPSTQRSSDS
jgi:FkbM family methyltransferase